MITVIIIGLGVVITLFMLWTMASFFSPIGPELFEENEQALADTENKFIEFTYGKILLHKSKQKIESLGEADFKIWLENNFDSLMMNYSLEKDTYFATDDKSRLISEIVKKFFENEPLK